MGAAAVVVAIAVVGSLRAWSYARSAWPGVQMSAQGYWLKLNDTLKGGTGAGGADGTAAGASAADGSLQVLSEPAGARVLVDGKLRGVTPLTLDGLKPGSHLIVLEGEGGTVSKRVVVDAGVTARVSERIFAGWVHVSAPFELLVTEGERGMSLDARNEILLAPGTHTLVFENRDLGYRETRRIQITPGATTAVSLVAPRSMVTVTATLPAQVFIDGERAGPAPLVDHAVAIGTRDITVRSDSGMERQRTITVTTAPMQIDVDFSKP